MTFAASGDQPKLIFALIEARIRSSFGMMMVGFTNQIGVDFLMIFSRSFVSKFDNWIRSRRPTNVPHTISSWLHNSDISTFISWWCYCDTLFEHQTMVYTQRCPRIFPVRYDHGFTNQIWVRNSLIIGGSPATAYYRRGCLLYTSDAADE